MKKFSSNWVIVFIPVIVCIVVFLLPQSWQELLVQKINNLNWWNWFTYIFVHENLTHIFFNLTMYVASISMALIIIPQEDKDKFYIPFLLMIFLVPLISLLLTLFLRDLDLFPRQLVNNRGFSGITSAASGILAFSIARRMQFLWKQLSNKNLLLNLCYFIFLPALGIMILRLSWKLSLVTFIFWFLSIYLIKWTLRRNNILIKKEYLNLQEIGILLLGLIVLFFGVSLLIPENVINNENGSVTNTIAHLMGFVIGSLIIFIYTLLSSKKETTKSPSSL